MAAPVPAKKPRAPRELDDSQLVTMLDQGIKASDCFENDLEDDRRSVMLEYFRGEMKDLVAEAGRSKAVMKMMADTIEALLPGLVRVFDGDKIVIYGPTRPEDGEGSRQATEYVNHVWAHETDGYLALLTAIHDALTVRNGILKAFWDTSEEYEVETLRRLDESQLVFLLEDADVQLIAGSEYEEMIRDPQSGAFVPATLYDVRIKRVSSRGRLVIEAVPPEDFGISKGAKTIDRARLVWQKWRKTRSELLADGYDRSKVEQLRAYDEGSDEPTTEAELAREDRQETGADVEESIDRSTDEIEGHECYVLVDMDGDGIAERWRVVKAGAVILDKEPWPEEDSPYVDLVPMIVPHRWQGQGIGDSTMDLQRIATALLRGFLDNLYQVNRPQKEVVEANIINSDEVLSPRFGGVVRVTQAGSVTPLVTEFVGDKAMLGLNYIDTINQRRTGVNGATAALDPTALEPQTATAEQLEHDNSYARVELIARNMANLGLKKLFAKVLRIIVRNQDRPRVLEMRGKWISYDPRAWNATMKVSVNIGQGTGSRERDLAMLAGVRKSQEQIMATLGPLNPLVKPSQYVGVLHKSVEAAGLNNPEEYFSPVTDSEFATWFESRPEKKDPKVEQAEKLLGVKVQEGQAKLALAAQGQRQDAETQKAKLASDAATRRAEIDAKIQAKREEMEMTFALRRQEMDLEFELKQRELEMEAQLEVGKLALGHMNGDPSVGGRDATNIPRSE